MCNLYAIMRARAEVARAVRAMTDRNSNHPPMSGVFPDYTAPIVRTGADGEREMLDMRWGMPTPRQVLFEAASKRADKLRAKGKEVDFAELLRQEPDKGVTNVRNSASKHWQPWLGPAHRCLVPFTSISERDQVGGTLQLIWFALTEERPLAFFAGITKPGHTRTRKAKEGEGRRSYLRSVRISHHGRQRRGRDLPQ